MHVATLLITPFLPSPCRLTSHTQSGENRLRTTRYRRNLPTRQSTCSMSKRRVTLVPWDAGSSVHVQELFEQRVQCGWNADMVESWKKEQEEGSKCIYWVVSVHPIRSLSEGPFADDLDRLFRVMHQIKKISSSGILKPIRRYARYAPHTGDSVGCLTTRDD